MVPEFVQEKTRTLRELAKILGTRLPDFFEKRDGPIVDGGCEPFSQEQSNGARCEPAAVVPRHRRTDAER